MSTKLYSVIFSGQIAEGQNLEKVQRNFIVGFKLDEARVKRLFSGKPIIVKSDLSYEDATIIKRNFAKAGAICYIKAVQTKANISEPKEKKKQTKVKDEMSASELIRAEMKELVKGTAMFFGIFTAFLMFISMIISLDSNITKLITISVVVIATCLLIRFVISKLYIIITMFIQDGKQIIDDKIGNYNQAKNSNKNEQTASIPSDADTNTKDSNSLSVIYSAIYTGIALSLTELYQVLIKVKANFQKSDAKWDMDFFKKQLNEFSTGLSQKTRTVLVIVTILTVFVIGVDTSIKGDMSTYNAKRSHTSKPYYTAEDFDSNGRLYSDYQKNIIKRNKDAEYIDAWGNLRRPMAWPRKSREAQLKELKEMRERLRK